MNVEKIKKEMKTVVLLELIGLHQTTVLKKGFIGSFSFP